MQRVTSVRYFSFVGKPFETIPGPKRFPFIGSLYMYKVPGVLGGYKISEYHKVLNTLYEKYGPIVREDRGRHTVIHLFDPDDVKTVFSFEGKSPVIPPLQEATQFYRAKRQLSLGLGNTNGEEWYRLRTAVQKMMLRPKEVSYYLPFVDSVAQSFTDKIETELDQNRVIKDLRTLVGKWTLESSGMICFETRLGAFDKNENLIEEMIHANRDIFKIAGELKLSLPIYKRMPTPRLKRFFSAEDFFYSYSSRFIDAGIAKINNLTKTDKDLQQFNFLSYLLSREELSLKDVYIITFSLFADGLSTTTPTFMYNLYLLAKHPEVQERVYAEIRKMLGRMPLTLDILNKLQLVKATVKEALRLYPNGTEVSRIVQRSMVLSGYVIPEQTHVDLNQFVHFRSSKYFSNPNDFCIDRWLREETGENKLEHPYLFIPFGHGTRMCAGRRFAEQDMFVGLTRILQKYHLELVKPTKEDELEQVYETLLFPKTPIEIRFIKRS